MASWYRPPDEEVESIDDLKHELEQHGKYALGVILVGDMNVHECTWLHFSNGTSIEGRALRDVAWSCGLKQFVRDPTRDGNLLDLVLSDIDNITCKVTPDIADHKGVFVTLKLPVPLSSCVKRTVWDYKNAEWEQLVSELESWDWSFIDNVSVDDCTELLTSTIIEAAQRSIPQRKIEEHKRTHPWMNDVALAAVAAKHAAAGTTASNAASAACSKPSRRSIINTSHGPRRN